MKSLNTYKEDNGIRCECPNTGQVVAFIEYHMNAEKHWHVQMRGKNNPGIRLIGEYRTLEAAEYRVLAEYCDR